MTQAEAKALSILNVQQRFSRETMTDRHKSAARQKWITEGEMQNIIGAVMRGTIDREATTQECMDVVLSVMNDRIMVASSNLAAKGLLDIEYHPSKPPGCQITYKMRSDFTDEEKAIITNACRKHESKATQSR